MRKYAQRSMNALAVLFFGILLAMSLSADSSGENLRRGFLYSDYLRADGGRAVPAGSFTVRNQVGFWARGGKIAAAAAARVQDVSLGRWVLDYAMEDADIIRRLRERAVAEGLAAGDLLAEGLVYSATEDWRAGGFIRTFEFDVKSALGGRFAHAGLNALGALRERENEAVAWQLRGYAGEDAQGGNAGIIYRRESAAGHLLGVNSFVDYESEDGGEAFWRWSLGGEFRSPWVDAFVNYYDALTDPLARGNSRIYTASGYDVEVNVHSPRYPWLVGSAGYYFWEGQFGDADDDGLRAGIKIIPRRIPLVLELEYQSGESGKNWGGQISYRHNFGEPSGGGIISGEFRARDWFYAPVQREYTQRIRGAPPSGNRPVAIRVLSLSGGDAEYSYDSTTLTLTAGIVRESPLPQSYPATLRTSGGGVISLSVIASRASGVVGIGSTVIFQPSGERTRPVVELLNGNVRLVSVRLESEDTSLPENSFRIFTAEGTIRVVENETNLAVDFSLDKPEGQRTSLAILDGADRSGGPSMPIFIDPPSGSGAVGGAVGCTSASNGNVGGIAFTQACPFALSIPQPFAKAVQGAPSALLATVFASGGGGAATYNYSLAGAPSQVAIGATTGIIRHTAVFTNLETVSFNVIAESEGETATAAFTLAVVLPSPVTLEVSPNSAVAVDGGLSLSVLATATATGGLGGTTYIYSLVGAPAEIVIDAASGVISLATAFTTTLTATFDIIAGSGSVSDTVSFRIRVIPPPPVRVNIAPSAAHATVSQSSGILATAEASGGLGAGYVYSLGGNAPSGVGIDSTSGLISLRGAFSSTGVIVFDVIGASRSSLGTASFRLTVVPELALALSPSEGEVVRGDSSGTLSRARASGGTGNYRYSLLSAPDEVSVGERNGELRLIGAFAAAGTHNFMVVADSNGARVSASFVLTVVNPPVRIEISPGSGRAVADIATGVLATVQAEGGDGGYTFSLEGNPSQIGISGINAVSAEIRWNTAFLQPERFTFRVIADDGAGMRATVSYSVEVLPAPLGISITPSSEVLRTEVPDNNIAAASVSGGRSPFRYSLAGSRLSELEINTAGVVFLNSLLALSDIGSYTVRVVVQDADNRRAEALLTLSVVDAPVLRINPSSVRVTTLDTVLELARAEVRGGESNVSYTYVLTALNSAHGNKLSLPVGGGAVRLAEAFTAAQTGLANFRIVATGGGELLTATLAVNVVAPPPLELDLSESSVRVLFGSGREVLSRARATGGRGNYSYSLVRNNAPAALDINTGTGDIVLNSAGLASVQATADIVVESGELRATVQFTLGIWGLEIVPTDKMATVRAGTAGSDAAGSLIQVNVLNPLAGAYSYRITRTTGGSFNAAELQISNSGAISAGTGLRLQSARTRHVLMARIIVSSAGGVEEVRDTVGIVIRPRALALDASGVNLALAVGDRAGITPGRITASEGEGTGNYQYSVSGALPLEVSSDGVVRLNGVITGAAREVPITFNASFGGETATAVRMLTVGAQLGLSVSPSALLITTGARGAAATASIANIPASDSGRYVYRLNNSSNFAGFGNLGINGSSGELRVNTGFGAAQAVNDFEVLAVHSGAGRTLTAVVSARVVAPLAVNLSRATAAVAVDAAAGILATARASGGDGSYTYSLGASAPSQIAVNNSGVIRYTAPFTVPGGHSFNIIATDGESRSATVQFVLTVSPAPLVLALPSSHVLRTEVGSGVIATAVADGGRENYVYSLINKPAQVNIDRDSGVLSLGSQFNSAVVVVLTVRVTDADGERADRLLTLRVVDAPVVAITPSAAVRVTAGVSGYVLATARVVGGVNGVTYTHVLTPVSSPSGKVSLPGGGGEIRLDNAFATGETGTANYRIVASGGGESFTATIAVEVVLPPELEIDLTNDSVRVLLGSSARTLSDASATGGFGNYVYSFSGNNLPAALDVDSDNGEISLTEAVDSGVQATADIIVASQLAGGGAVSEELRATAKFTLGVWGLGIVPADKSATVRAGTSASSLIQVNIINPLPGAHSYRITRTNGNAFGAAELQINSSGAISAGTGLALLAAQTRHTITARVMVSPPGGGEAVRDTVEIVVIPRALALDAGGINLPLAVGDGAGITPGRITASEGEGTGNYQYSYGGALPLAIRADGVVALNGVIPVSAAGTVPITFSVSFGTETATAVRTFTIGGRLSLSVSPSTVVITTNRTGAAAAASIVNVPSSDSGNYRYEINDSSNFAGFGNLRIDANSGELRVNTGFGAAQAADEFEVVAVHAGAGRRLTATVSARVVAPLAVNVLQGRTIATVAADIATGILATARASGGDGSYSYSLTNEPSEIAINSSSGVVNVASAFDSPGEHSFNIIATDGESRSATVPFVVTVSPAPLGLELTPSSEVVRTGSTRDIASAIVDGGRSPYRYELINGAPTEVNIGADDGALFVETAFSGAAAWTLTVQVTDADGETDEASFILMVVDAPGLVITPSSDVRVTILDTGLVLATAEVRGGTGGETYTYQIAPISPAPAGKISLPSGGGDISLDNAYTAGDIGTANYRIVATETGGGGESFTATLAVEVVAPPPLLLDLTETSVRVLLGGGRQVLSQATARDGRGNFSYSLAGNNLPGALGIDASSGEISLSEGINSSVQVTADIIAASGELRTTVKFTLGVWGLEITPDKSEEVRAGTTNSDGNDSLMQVNVINPLPGGGYTYGITRAGSGAAFRAAELEINSGNGEISAGRGLTLLAARTRHTVTVQVRVATGIGGGEEVLDTVLVVVRPRAVELNAAGINLPLAVGDGAGITPGRIAASEGEGTGDYVYSSGGALPFVIGSDGVVALNGVIPGSAAGAVPITFSVSFGGETATVVETFNIGARLSVSVLPDSVLITTNATGAAATASIVNVLSSDSGNYRYEINDSSNFANFGNLRIDENSGELRVNTAFGAAQAADEFEVVAVHAGAGRRLTATVSMRVVAPVALNVVGGRATATVAVGVASGVLATADASGGDGNYTYSLDSEPSQIAINSSSGVINLASAFDLPGEHSFNIIATDGESRSDTAAFVVTVSPAPLALVLPSAATVRASATSGLIATAVADGGRRDYSYSLINSAPSQVNINENTGVLFLGSAFSRAGAWTLTVQAEDADGETAQALLTLEVAPRLIGSRAGVRIVHYTVPAVGDGPGVLLGRVGVEGGRPAVVGGLVFTHNEVLPLTVNVSSIIGLTAALTVQGEFDVTVTVSTADGDSYITSFRMTVGPPVLFSVSPRTISVLTNTSGYAVATLSIANATAVDGIRSDQNLGYLFRALEGAPNFPAVINNPGFRNEGPNNSTTLSIIAAFTEPGDILLTLDAFLLDNDSFFLDPGGRFTSIRRVFQTVTVRVVGSPELQITPPLVTVVAEEGVADISLAAAQVLFPSEGVSYTYALTSPAGFDEHLSVNENSGEIRITAAFSAADEGRREFAVVATGGDSPLTATLTVDVISALQITPSSAEIIAGFTGSVAVASFIVSPANAGSYRFTLRAGSFAGIDNFHIDENGVLSVTAAFTVSQAEAGFDILAISDAEQRTISVEFRAEITPLPLALVYNELTQARVGDVPGVVVGTLVATGGGGNYRYSVERDPNDNNNILPFGVDETTGIVSVTVNLNTFTGGRNGYFPRFIVEEGTERVQLADFVRIFEVPLALRVSQPAVEIALGATRNQLARASFAATPGDVGSYRFTLRAGSFSGIENFEIDENSGFLSLTNAFTAPQEGAAFEILAIHEAARRTIVAEFRVTVVAPLALRYEEITAPADGDSPGVVVGRLVATGGRGGDYRYSEFDLPFIASPFGVDENTGIVSINVNLNGNSYPGGIYLSNLRVARGTENVTLTLTFNLDSRLALRVSQPAAAIATGFTGSLAVVSFANPPANAADIASYRFTLRAGSFANIDNLHIDENGVLSVTSQFTAPQAGEAFEILAIHDAAKRTLAIGFRVTVAGALAVSYQEITNPVYGDSAGVIVGRLEASGGGGTGDYRYFVANSQTENSEVLPVGVDETTGIVSITLDLTDGNYAGDNYTPVFSVRRGADTAELPAREYAFSEALVLSVPNPAQIDTRFTGRVATASFVIPPADAGSYRYSLSGGSFSNIGNFHISENGVLSVTARFSAIQAEDGFNIIAVHPEANRTITINFRVQVFPIVEFRPPQEVFVGRFTPHEVSGPLATAFVNAPGNWRYSLFHPGNSRVLIHPDTGAITLREPFTGAPLNTRSNIYHAVNDAGITISGVFSYRTRTIDAAALNIPDTVTVTVGTPLTVPTYGYGGTAEERSVLWNFENTFNVNESIVSGLSRAGAIGSSVRFNFPGSVSYFAGLAGQRITVQVRTTRTSRDAGNRQISNFQKDINIVIVGVDVPLAVSYQEITSPVYGDSAGVVVGRLEASGGEGAGGYRYFVANSQTENSEVLPVGVDETTGIVSITLDLTDGDYAGDNYTPVFSVQRGADTAELPAREYAFSDALALEFLDPAQIDIQFTGSVAVASFATPPADAGSYRYELRGGSFPNVDNFHLSENGVLSVTARFSAEQAEDGFEILAIHDAAKRTIAADFRARILPILVITPASLTIGQHVPAEITGPLATASVNSADTWTYALVGNTRAEIDPNTGVITLREPFTAVAAAKDITYIAVNNGATIRANFNLEVEEVNSVLQLPNNITVTVGIPLTVRTIVYGGGRADTGSVSWTFVNRFSANENIVNGLAGVSGSPGLLSFDFPESIPYFANLAGQRINARVQINRSSNAGTFQRDINIVVVGGAPSFNITPASVDVGRFVPPRFADFAVTATVGGTGNWTYSLPAGNPPEIGIDSASGVINLVSQFTESPRVHVVSVKAVESGGTETTAQFDLNIVHVATSRIFWDLQPSGLTITLGIPLTVTTEIYGGAVADGAVSWEYTIPFNAPAAQTAAVLEPLNAGNFGSVIIFDYNTDNAYFAGLAAGTTTRVFAEFRRISGHGRSALSFNFFIVAPEVAEPTGPLALSYNRLTNPLDGDIPGVVVGSLVATGGSGGNYRYSIEPDPSRFARGTLPFGVGETTGIVSITLNVDSGQYFSNYRPHFIVERGTESVTLTVADLDRNDFIIGQTPLALQATPPNANVEIGFTGSVAVVSIAFSFETSDAAAYRDIAEYRFALRGDSFANFDNFHIDENGVISVTAAFTALQAGDTFEILAIYDEAKRTIALEFQAGVDEELALSYREITTPRFGDAVGVVIGSLQATGGGGNNYRYFIEESRSQFEQDRTLPFGVDETTGLVRITVQDSNPYTPVFGVSLGASRAEATSRRFSYERTPLALANVPPVQIGIGFTGSLTVVSFTPTPAATDSYRFTLRAGSFSDISNFHIDENGVISITAAFTAAQAQARLDILAIYDEARRTVTAALQAAVVRVLEITPAAPEVGKFVPPQYTDFAVTANVLGAGNWTYSLRAGHPAEIEIDSASGVINLISQFSATAAHVIIVDARESGGDELTAEFNLNVAQVATATVLWSAAAGLTITSGIPLTVTTALYGGEAADGAVSWTYSIPSQSDEITAAFLAPLVGENFGSVIVFNYTPLNSYFAGLAKGTTTQINAVFTRNSGHGATEIAFPFSIVGGDPLATVVDITPSAAAVGAFVPPQVAGALATANIAVGDWTYSLRAGHRAEVSINPDTGVINLASQFTATGVHVITVDATESGGTQISGTFTLTVRSVAAGGTLLPSHITVVLDIPLTVTTFNFGGDSRINDSDLVNWQWASNDPEHLSTRGNFVDPLFGVDRRQKIVFEYESSDDDLAYFGPLLFPDTERQTIDIQYARSAFNGDVDSGLREFTLIVEGNRLPRSSGNIGTADTGRAFSAGIAAEPGRTYTYSLGANAPGNISINPDSGVVNVDTAFGGNPRPSGFGVIAINNYGTRYFRNLTINVVDRTPPEVSASALHITATLNTFRPAQVVFTESSGRKFSAGSQGSFFRGFDGGLFFLGANNVSAATANIRLFDGAPRTTVYSIVFNNNVGLATTVSLTVDVVQNPLAVNIVTDRDSDFLPTGYAVGRNAEALVEGIEAVESGSSAADGYTIGQFQVNGANAPCIPANGCNLRVYSERNGVVSRGAIPNWLSIDSNGAMVIGENQYPSIGIHIIEVANLTLEATYEGGHATPFFLTVREPRPFSVPIVPSAFRVERFSSSGVCISPYRYDRNGDAVGTQPGCPVVARVNSGLVVDQPLMTNGDIAPGLEYHCDLDPNEPVAPFCIVIFHSTDIVAGVHTVTLDTNISSADPVSSIRRRAIGVMTVFVDVLLGGGEYSVQPPSANTTVGVLSQILATADVIGADEVNFGEYAYTLQREDGEALPAQLSIGGSDGIIRLNSAFAAGQTLTLEVVANNGGNILTTGFTLTVVATQPLGLSIEPALLEVAIDAPPQTARAVVSGGNPSSPFQFEFAPLQDLAAGYSANGNGPKIAANGAISVRFFSESGVTARAAGYVITVRRGSEVAAATLSVDIVAPEIVLSPLSVEVFALELAGVVATASLDFAASRAYSYSLPNPPAQFSIDSNTGVISQSSAFPDEVREFDLTVVATFGAINITATLPVRVNFSRVGGVFSPPRLRFNVGDSLPRQVAFLTLYGFRNAAAVAEGGFIRAIPGNSRLLSTNDQGFPSVLSPIFGITFTSAGTEVWTIPVQTQASGPGRRVGEAKITVYIGEDPPPATIDDVLLIDADGGAERILLNAPVGTVIPGLDITLINPLPGESAEYSLRNFRSTFPGDTDLGNIVIDPNTGVISVGTVHTCANVNRDGSGKTVTFDVVARYAGRELVLFDRRVLISIIRSGGQSNLC